MGSIVDLKQYADESYLSYSMYVILDRALPNIGDGLKPVQRRLVYAMDGLSLDYKAKYKKSARTIGDVLGKYHPHGDSACYEAMVLMAQPFSFRYPLVDGQGNWGSQDDPKSFAAMRYTEARLSRNAPLLLDEMAFNAVDEQSNFDGTMMEPKVLPAQVPFILLNGTAGIAVGMACDIPPHNLTEVCRALRLIIDDHSASLDDIMNCIPAPDLPSGGQITSTPEEIRQAYKAGRGGIRVRCTYEVVGSDIVITELPYKVRGERVIESIANLAFVKKQIPQIDDVRDESDKDNPTRIVVSLKRSAAGQAEQIMNALLATTDLETSVRLNVNVINRDGSPAIMNLPLMLAEWLQFRVETVRRRTEFQRKKVDDRLHIIEGLLKAFLDLDEVIRIVRFEDKPHEALMSSLGLSDIQAKTILNTRLGNLAKLEEMNLKSEENDLKQERQRLSDILSSDTSLKATIREELLNIESTYGDARRSVIAPAAPAAQKAADLKQLGPSEPVTVMVSRNGYVRCAKNHDFAADGLNYKTGDRHLAACNSQSNRDVTLIGSTGRCYFLPCAELPSARSNGDPVTKWVMPEAGTAWVDVIDPEASDKWFVFGSEGTGFIANKSAFLTRAKKGKVLLNKAGEAQPPQPCAGASHIAALTTLGRLLVFPIDDLPELEKGKGNRLCGTKSGEKFAHATVISQESSLRIKCEDGKIVELPAEQWIALVRARAQAPVKVTQATSLPISFCG